MAFVQLDNSISPVLAAAASCHIADQLYLLWFRLLLDNVTSFAPRSCLLPPQKRTEVVLLAQPHRRCRYGAAFLGVVLQATLKAHFCSESTFPRDQFCTHQLLFSLLPILCRNLEMEDLEFIHGIEERCMPGEVAHWAKHIPDRHKHSHSQNTYYSVPMEAEAGGSPEAIG